MSTTIHPTAIIEHGAELASDVKVGAYAYIGARAKIGAGCVIAHHATVDGNTTLGANNLIHPYAYIGGPTQDLKFKGGHPALIIGDSNNFREYATVHCGTTEEVPTRVGSGNNFLSYTHIAHECQVGSGNIFSNSVQLAGHVEVADGVVIGGLTGVHQFVRIGSYAMIGGCSAVVKDVPPFMMAAGNHAVVVGINKVGMDRNGYTTEEIDDAFRAFKVVFKEGHTPAHLPDHLRARLKTQGRVLEAIEGFLKTTQRGLATAAK